MKKILSILLLSFSVTTVFAQYQLRLRENFDFDWKFSLSDDIEYANLDYADALWEDVQLPHDWNIKQMFDFKQGGSVAYLPDGIGWYRKTFRVPASSKGKKLLIHFDGIFMQSDVYVNGQHLGYRPYGFCSIEYDLTPYISFDKENVLAVRVNTTGGRPRWYAGAGIYRHVWLKTLNPVHVATYGTYVTTPQINAEKADVHIVTKVNNTSVNEQKISVQQTVFDNKGHRLERSSSLQVVVAAGSTADVVQELTLNNPQLWSIDTPNLYRIETTVKVDGRMVDVYSTSFGVRTFKFDKNNGFLLNGHRIKLKGMCLHHDAGSLGTAVPDRSYERRLEILKEYGCNAIRCAHNQPSPEFLDMCDRMGFVVIDEAFDKWKSGYYEKYFDEWWQKDITDMVLRDRNHPSVALWSIGNELQEAWDQSDAGVERARMLQDFVHKLDPTRLVTLAAQNNHQEKFAGVTDVIGYNYLEARMLTDHRNHPERIFLISEELPYYRGEEGNIRSYTTLNPWYVIAENDFVAGGFIWSGVDYLGEAGWPSKGWPNGLFDICMDEKPRAAFHRAMWNSEPMVRIAIPDPSLNVEHGRDLWQWPKLAAHWNFPQSYIGMVIELQTTTNCENVELFLNDKLMGKQSAASFPNNTIIWHLPYMPGKLVAKGYNGNKELAYYQLITSGNTAQAVVTPDCTKIKADGQDLSHISICLADEEGNLVQTDDKLVSIRVEGEGRFLSIDNGDLRREQTFAGNSIRTYFGKALAVVQATRKPGKMTVYVKVDGIEKEYVVEVTSVIN